MIKNLGLDASVNELVESGVHISIKETIIANLKQTENL